MTEETSFAFCLTFHGFDAPLFVHSYLKALSPNGRVAVSKSADENNLPVVYAALEMFEAMTPAELRSKIRNEWQQALRMLIPLTVRKSVSLMRATRVVEKKGVVYLSWKRKYINYI